ncbi:MAG: dNTP triphosphohydrolase [Paludibacter sp.]|jgi:dGTPase|nr:dNTP triphosphohydrolase [Paludibacter sp.]
MVSNIIERWDELLYPKRFRVSRAKGTTEYKGTNYNRIPFDSDYLRIALSSPFRRLQDKAQVFPLDTNDFSRTRLTHSVEVSGIGRSIGTSVEKILIEKKLLSDKKFGHIPSLLSVAGLVHDIGNPPFGHFGEKTIQNYFDTLLNGKQFNQFTDEEKNDFKKFDGNVQGFRLLLKLGLSDDEYSFNFTFPVLSSIIKYPKSSTKGNASDWEEKGIEFKKFGFFQSEKNKYEEINNLLKLNSSRHPLTFLLEAADDIAYCVSDIEDGVKKKIISSDFILNLLKSEKYSSDEKCVSLLNQLTEYSKKINDFPFKELLFAQECRIKAQSIMIQDSVNEFIDSHEKLLNGEYHGELLKSSKSFQLREFFEEIANKNFNYEEVLKNEIVGEKVVYTLLDYFVPAILSENCTKKGTKENKLYELISSHYKYINKYFESYPNETYKKLLLVTDYISGMTDTYALTLYQELTGIKMI